VAISGTVSVFESNLWLGVWEFVTLLVTTRRGLFWAFVIVLSAAEAVLHSIWG
jgi:hypothetical protein